MWTKKKLQGITDGDESCIKSEIELQWFKINETTVGQNYVVESKFFPEPLTLLYYNSNGYIKLMAWSVAWNWWKSGF